MYIKNHFLTFYANFWCFVSKLVLQLNYHGLLRKNCIAYLGSLLYVLSKGVSNFSILSSFNRLLDELIIDILVHKGSGASTADLPLVDEDSLMCKLHCLVNLNRITLVRSEKHKNLTGTTLVNCEEEVFRLWYSDGVILKYKPSASLCMMRGLFPPSSSDTFFRLDLAASVMMMRPTWKQKGHV